ncbi:hypothetical protein JHK85_004910 [Glycine max]|nr:hypothetical protein JHK85_004910 [Glycine max]
MEELIKLHHYEEIRSNSVKTHASHNSNSPKMKREGRQHGMVRSYRILPNSLNPRPNTRFITQFDAPPTAGFFVKVSSKPTNHSKFTGKCGTPRCTGCHLHPACKSKDKTKGTQKRKHWRVIVDQPNSDFFGLSATVTLDNLSHDYYEDESGDRVDYSGTLDDYDGENNNGNKCVSEIGGSFQMDQVAEDEDWLLVESCS